VLIFGDGGVVGPDTEEWVPKVRARLDAERDVLAAASRAPDLRGHLLAVRQSAFAALPSSGVIDAGQLYMQAVNASSYNESYAFMKGYVASRLLSSIDIQGEVRTLDTVRTRLMSKTCRIEIKR